MSENELAVQDISEIVVQNDIGASLSLFKVAPAQEEKTVFHEVLSNGIIAAQSLVGVAQVVNAAKIVGQPFLFSNSASISTLMKLSKGGFGSAVVSKAGKITAQSGFNPVAINPVMLNPVGAMIAVAMIMIKSEFAQLNKKLDRIDEKVGKLIEFHHDEKLSILQTADERIKAITNKNNVEEIDIIELRNIGINVREVFHEYKRRFEKTNVAELLRVNGISDNENLKSLDKNLKAQAVELNFKVAYFADYLTHFIKLVEIVSRIKKGDGEEIIKEHILHLKKEVANSFTNNAPQHLEKFARPIIDKALSIISENNNVSDFASAGVDTAVGAIEKLPKGIGKGIGKAWNKAKDKQDDKKIDLIEGLNDIFNDLLKPLVKENVGEIVNRTLDELTKPRKIVYLFDKNSAHPRTFIAEEAS